MEEAWVFESDNIEIYKMVLLIDARTLDALPVHLQYSPLTASSHTKNALVLYVHNQFISSTIEQS
jgi:hypothetical protein